MGDRESEGALQRDPVSVVLPEMGGDAIASPPISDCNQLEPHFKAQSSPSEWDADSQMRQRRDQLLEAIARAANVLLTLENLSEAIHTALNIIGAGAGCDLIAVIENVFESASPLPAYCNFIYEWAAPGLPLPTANLRSRSLPSEFIGLAFLEQYFLEGSGFGGLVEDWHEPLRSWLASVQVQSAYTVPIRVNGQWWGVLCFDYCRAPIQIGAAEIAVLRTIADCIGSAIQRDRLKQERQQDTQQRVADLEAYNRTLQGRDRLLESAAKATNVLLTVENLDEAINSTLKIIGEGIGCDRFHILENILEPSSTLPIRFSYIYEWSRPEFTRSLAQLELAAVQAAQLEDAFIEQYFLKGNGFGGLLEVWPESLQNSPTADQVQSAYAVPIRVNRQWWGVLAFHYCRGAIQISPAEVSVLMTIADCIGSAIQRDRTQKIILQAEQTRVAELVKANSVLKQSLDTFAADSDLDRFIGNTLTVIAQQFDATLVEYWVHAQAGSEASIHLAYWQGQILSAANGSIVGADPLGMIPFLDIPLSVGDTTIGALSIYLPIHHTFSGQTISGQTIELAHALAQQLTLAIELTRLAEESQQSALLQERTRMAREIHDTLAQAFGGILMQLQACTYFAQTQPDQAQTHLLTAQALAQEGLTEARRSVWTLYLETTKYENIDQAIAKFIEQTMSRQSTPILLTIEGTPYSLHPDLGLNLLRIAQEAIANALRHAHATTVQVHLSYSAQSLQLTICDDGCGFDPQSPTQGFGLLGMQQRASRIGAIWNLMSRPGEGTTLMITLTNNLVRKLS